MRRCLASGARPNHFRPVAKVKYYSSFLSVMLQFPASESDQFFSAAGGLAECGD
jgi:hypothetical protein